MTQETHMTEQSVFLPWFEAIDPEEYIPSIPDEDLKLYDNLIKAFDQASIASQALFSHMSDKGLADDFDQAWEEFYYELTHDQLTYFAYHLCESLAFARGEQY